MLILSSIETNPRIINDAIRTLQFTFDTQTDGSVVIKDNNGNALLTLDTTHTVVGVSGAVLDLGPASTAPFEIRNQGADGVRLNLINDTVSASPVSSGCLVNFYLTNTASDPLRFASVQGAVVTNTASAEDGKIAFKIARSGTVSEETMVLGGAVNGGGLQLGIPTGLDKGFGTLNVKSGIYFNGNGPLNDYEEGTWNPVLTTSGVNFTSVTYSSQTGTYKRVGSIVVASCTLITSAVTIGSATGNIQITGLPFAAGNNEFAVDVGYATGWVTVLPTHAILNGWASNKIGWIGTSNYAALTVANVSATVNYIYCTVAYHT